MQSQGPAQRVWEGPASPRTIPRASGLQAPEDARSPSLSWVSLVQLGLCPRRDECPSPLLFRVEKDPLSALKTGPFPTQGLLTPPVGSRDNEPGEFSGQQAVKCSRDRQPPEDEMPPAKPHFLAVDPMSRRPYTPSWSPRVPRRTQAAEWCGVRARAQAPSAGECEGTGRGADPGLSLTCRLRLLLEAVSKRAL